MDLSEESIPLNGSYPMYRWASDGKTIVIHQGGKIRRVDVATDVVSAASTAVLTTAEVEAAAVVVAAPTMPVAVAVEIYSEDY